MHRPIADALLARICHGAQRACQDAQKVVCCYAQVLMSEQTMLVALTLLQ